jgi:predicted transcriptional regulator
MLKWVRVSYSELTEKRIRAPLIVGDEPAKQRILSAMADEYSRKILTATTEIPMSALELSKKYEIPITTVYRRIEELVEAGLIAAVKSGRTTDGKWYDLYRSLLKRIDVSFEKGEVRIDVIVNEHVADKFTRMWTSIPTI